MMGEPLLLFCWLPILALITLLIAWDIWKHRDLLRMPLYFRLSVFIIVNQFAAMGILVYDMMDGTQTSFFLLHLAVLFVGGCIWGAAVSPILKREQQRKRKLKSEVSVPAKLINPHSAYVIGNDGEIIEVADDKKRKRGE